ncbi:MAG: hypothetical protein BRC30_02045 [Nanohaloarchaea archaeon SW_7_46_7]|nr:MAG: hypothetical protein BRC30_02045 [Nanohaloarchaea archaeon SW_7_46_7]
MKSEEIPVTVTSEEYGFDEEDLVFSYTEKDSRDRKVERYQLKDEFGVVLSGEKVWRTEEKNFLGLWTFTEEVYEEDVQKRVTYDNNRKSVITEEASWNEFQKLLQDTDAYKSIF